MESEAEMVDGFVVVGNAKMVVDTNAVANFMANDHESATSGIRKIIFQKLGSMRFLNEKVAKQNATMIKHNEKLLKKNDKVIHAIERLLILDADDLGPEIDQVKGDMEDTALSCAALNVVMEHLKWDSDVFQDFFMDYIIEKGTELNAIVPYTYDCEEGALHFREYVLSKGFEPEQTVTEWEASSLYRAFTQLNTRHCARLYMSFVFQALDDYVWSNDNYQNNGLDNCQGNDQDGTQGYDDQGNGLGDVSQADCVCKHSKAW
ncbi:hypothetical protein CH63R_06918 [Colletotrichum higginsianum IMI 349063]|uniref:Uncharacterized protein n=2 Tax=Colletotrichum higginsianum TaxID=80884 RepID=A0A1B7YGP6_COLHI|nr:hypothetical protein CH63R_06918 [Colletotrichum higginsianum IMI 349063]OBR11226.1 hypothetical protein CH63R_06918 [Colletotrichum higginsianum IMI 349063]GJD01450.1 hypothetical protein ColKHC_10275 [Colletotrichum higginsianum]